MRKFFLVLAVAVGVWIAGVSLAGPAVKIPLFGWPEGVQQGRKERRLLLVCFHQAAGSLCERTDAVAFIAKGVQAGARRCFVPVKVESFDARQFPGPSGEKLSGILLRDRFKVSTFPTVVVLDFRDPFKEYLRIPGYLGPKDFLEMLTYVTQGWYTEMPFDEFLDRLLNKRLPAKGSRGTC